MDQPTTQPTKTCMQKKKLNFVKEEENSTFETNKAASCLCSNSSSSYKLSLQPKAKGEGEDSIAVKKTVKNDSI